jgi:peptidoglycan/LPS O-acetylase OafA/YrhL
VYTLNLLGGASVRIFFVLSGLFISRTIIKALIERRWNWTSYLINRFSRLYVVLIPALILTLVLDQIGLEYLGTQIETENEGVITFIGNLFFLQSIFVPTYGSNHPLWSLSLEFWYYILFPLLVLILVKRANMKFVVLNLAVVMIIMSCLGLKISFYFLIWLMGTFILFLPIKSFFSNWTTLFVSFIFFLISCLLRPFANTGKLFGDIESTLIIVDTLIGISFVLFIYVILNYFSKKREYNKAQISIIFEKLSRLLSGFSFSLYLIHQPIIEFVYALALSWGFTGFKPGLLSFLIELLIIIVMLCITYLFSRLTERNTHKVRRYISNKVKRKSELKQVA